MLTTMDDLMLRLSALLPVVTMEDSKRWAELRSELFKTSQQIADKQDEIAAMFFRESVVT